MSVLLNPFQLLELNIVSAQDIAMVSRSMRTYAVVWIRPDRKLSTRLDVSGKNNPTWNDKFIFRIDEDFLRSETSSIMIEIYASHWFKDMLVGSVAVLVSNVVPPPSRPFQHKQHFGMRFVALQVRRPSGRPQGILNIGVAVLDSSMRSMPLYSQPETTSSVGFRDLLVGNNQDQENINNYNSNTNNNIIIINSNNNDDDPAVQRTEQQHNQLIPPALLKPGLRRSKSDTSSMKSMKNDNAKKTLKRRVSFREKPNSVISFSVGGSSSAQEKRNDKSPKRSSMASVSHLSISKVKILKPATKNRGSLVGMKVNKPNNQEVKGFNLEVQPPKATNVKLFFNRRSPKKQVITQSELGPSASEVAAAIAAKERYQFDKVEHSGVGEGWSLNNESIEGLQSKLERWRMELPPIYDNSGGEFSRYPSSRKTAQPPPQTRGRRRSKSEGDGLFSCFSNICGIECSIVCGGNNVKSRKKSLSKRALRSPSSVSTSYV